MAIAETTQGCGNRKKLIFHHISLNPSPGLVFIDTISKPGAAAIMANIVINLM